MPLRTCVCRLPAALLALCSVGCDRRVDAPVRKPKLVARGTIPSNRARQETNVTRDHFHQMDTDICGDKVVWVDLRHNTKTAWRRELCLHRPCTSDIYLHDLGTGETRRLTATKTWKVIPRVRDDHVMWREQRSQDDYADERTIVMNLSTGEETVLEDGYSWRLLPGGKVVFVREGICMMDMKTKEVTKLVSEKPGAYARMTGLDASGEYVIWLQEFLDGGKLAERIHAFNIRSKREVRLAKHKREGSSPGISEDMIVWVDVDVEALAPTGRGSRRHTYRVCLQQLPDGEVRTVASSPRRLTCPRINVGRITYVGDFSYGVFDTTTGKTTTIRPINSCHPARGLKISGSRVAWVDGGDVHVLDLEALSEPEPKLNTEPDALVPPDRSAPERAGRKRRAFALAPSASLCVSPARGGLD